MEGELVELACPACSARIRVSREYLGRKAKCQGCGHVFVLRQSPLAAPAEAGLVPPVSPSPVGPVGSVYEAPAPAPAPGGPLDLAALRDPSESVLRTICLVFSILFYVATLGLGLLYVLLFMLMAYFVLALMLAEIRGNGIKVGPDQLPHVYASAQRAAAAMGLSEMPEVYVVQSGGILNAFAARWAFRRYVVLYSDLIDACGDDSRELDMVMGHEMGHIALGHLTWLWILLPGRLIPFLGQAYSRACEYSCDRCGQAVCGDAAASMRGLLVLAAGGNCARAASLDAFMRQGSEVEGFWLTVVGWFSTHPWLTRRVQALAYAPQAAR